MKKKMTVATLQRKARMGNVLAQYYLSIVYEDGRAVARDLKKSAHWCLRAAQNGDRMSQYRLSKMFDSGKGLSAANPVAALYWLGKAAWQGHVQAQVDLGMRHLFGVRGASKNADAAQQWFLRAAKAGHADAAYYLGFMHAHGVGVERDPCVGVAYLKQAAEQQCLKAQCSLAFHYAHGLGCEKNLALSRKLYEQSAFKGHLGAQFALGCMTLGDANYDEAFYWFSIAAHRGMVPAQALLAKFYSHGLGVQRDLVSSLMWCFIVQNAAAGCALNGGVVEDGLNVDVKFENSRRVAVVEVDEESLNIVAECFEDALPHASQTMLDDAYTLASNWIERHGSEYCSEEADAEVRST